jgi:RNA polymerase sigma-70 factor, ECF subfamily
MGRAPDVVWWAIFGFGSISTPISAGAEDGKGLRNRKPTRSVETCNEHERAWMTASADFQQLYEREFAAVYRAAYALSGDRELAEDAAQEAFARALARWRRLGRERWAGGWVMTTALNFTRRQMRKRPLATKERPVDADADALLDIRRAIETLPARQQSAVVLHYLMGLPLAEVAGSMGCREGTVKSHLARARAALGVRLSDDISMSGRN